MDNGEPQCEQLQRPQIVDLLQAHEVFTDQAGAVLARPAARVDIRAAIKRLRESAQPQQIEKLLSVLQTQLRRREWVQPQQVVAALEGVAAETVEVEARAARHEDSLPARSAVPEALDVRPSAGRRGQPARGSPAAAW